MAISARAVGAWAYAASGSVTPTLPTHALGDMLMVRVAYKSSAIATCAASVATSGWIKLGEFHDGTTNSGNGVGSVAVAHFWKIAQSAAEANPTVAFSQAVTQVGHSAVSFQKASTEFWIDPVGDGGGFAAGAPISATIQSHVSVTSGDMVVFFLGSRDDTAFTSPTITQTGVTFDTVTEYPATAGLDGSGADGSYDAGYRLATAGTSSAAAVVTATIASETGSAWMTRLRVFTPTKVYLHDSTDTYSTGNNDARLDASTGGWTPNRMLTTRDDGVVATSTNTVAGTTSGVEVALGSALGPRVWYSLPLDADITISGPIAFNIWARENNASANVAINGRLDVIDGATGTITLIHQTTRTTEAVVSTTAYFPESFVGTPSSGVACKRGDRLRFRIFGDDAGTMGSGFTFTIQIGATSADVTGDTWIGLTESATFSSEPAGSTVYPTDTASAVSTASVDREVWTSRGAGVQTDVTNSTTGWTAPLQVTDTAGGTVVDWFTKQLTAFTLGGAVRVNARLATSNTASNTNPAIEIARVDSDGTNATVWGKASTALGIAASESDRSFIVSGDDLAISEGQRLRVRLLIDDAGFSAMVTGHTATLYYAGTSGGASGDTYLTFSQTLTEFTAGTNAAAQLASGTGAANTPSTLVVTNASLASGAGSAEPAVIQTGIATNSGTATGTGSALAASVLLAVSSALASGTGTAHNATVQVAQSVSADLATGSGTAYDATVSAAAAETADAGLASGSGTAHNATTSIETRGGLASGTGTANAPAVSVGRASGIATGTGTANTPAASGAVNAGNATGTGLANNATVSTATFVSVNAGHASGSGTANNATVHPFTTVAAGLASGTGTANGIDAAIEVRAGNAAGTGTALNATVSTVSSETADAGHAAGTGTANPIDAAIAVNAGNAAGTGTANNATASAASFEEANAQVATGTGTAYNASVPGVTAASAGLATGTGQANTPAASVAGSSGSATGTGSATAPAPGVGAGAVVATGTGTAYDPVISGAAVTAAATLAEGTGTAYNATTRSTSSRRSTIYDEPLMGPGVIEDELVLVGGIVGEPVLVGSALATGVGQGSIVDEVTVRGTIARS